MRISTNDSILGIPILDIRRLLKRGRSFPWSIDLAIDCLGIEEGEARKLIAELAKREFVEPDGTADCWRNTVQGNALAMAKAARPVRRQSADQVFAKFMERVKEVNANSYFLLKVKRVVLFGSYLSDSPTVNDIDAAVELEPKESDSERRDTLYERRRRLLQKKGKQFRNISEYAAAPELEVYSFLKSHSRTLSIHQISDDMWRRGNNKTIYCAPRES